MKKRSIQRNVKVVFFYFVYSLIVTVILGEAVLRIIHYRYVPIKIEQLGREVPGLGKTD